MLGISLNLCDKRMQTRATQVLQTSLWKFWDRRREGRWWGVGVWGAEAGSWVPRGEGEAFLMVVGETGVAGLGPAQGHRQPEPSLRPKLLGRPVTSAVLPASSGNTGNGGALLPEEASSGNTLSPGDPDPTLEASLGAWPCRAEAVG